SGVSFEGRCLLPYLRVPYLHCLVRTARDDALAVGGECHTGDRFSVSLEGEKLLSGVRVPHLHRLISAPRGDALAVDGERHATGVGVSHKGELLLPCVRVPLFYLPIALT